MAIPSANAQRKDRERAIKAVAERASAKAGGRVEYARARTWLAIALKVVLKVLVISRIQT